MENFEHQEEMEVSTSSNHETKPYVPQQLNFSEDENPDDILKQLDIPQLTDGQKEDLVSSCEQKVDFLINQLWILMWPATKDSTKEGAFNTIKSICDPNARVKINIKNNDKLNSYTWKNFTMDEFWDKIKSNEIDLKELKLFMVWYNRWEFIPEYADGATNYYRKIKSLHFWPIWDSRWWEGISITWIEDINTDETIVTK